MTNERTTKQFTVTGKCGALVVVEADVYESGVIVAAVETEHVTRTQFAKALRREFPRHTFYTHIEGDQIVAQADSI